MYTIRQAAIRSGLTIPTIRAWERRCAALRVADHEGVIVPPDAMDPAIDVVRRLAQGGS